MSIVMPLTGEYFGTTNARNTLILSTTMVEKDHRWFSSDLALAADQATETMQYTSTGNVYSIYG